VIRKCIAISLFCSLLFLLIWSLSSSPQSRPEPVFEGRSLSAWLDDLAFGSSKEVREPAEDALRKIGVDSLPFLVEMFRQRETTLNRALLKLNHKQSLLHFRARTVARDRTRALLAFEALGRQAVPALPQLASLLPHHQQPELLADAMAAIGPESVPRILEAVSKVPPEKRCMLLANAMKWPSQKQLLVAALEKSRTSRYPPEAACATEMLARCKARAN